MQHKSTDKTVGQPIVCGGGWKEGHRRMGRPKAALFLMLSGLWVFPSLGALWLIVFHDDAWRNADGLQASLREVRLEQWIAFALLLAHAVFGWLAWHYRRHEPLQELFVGEGRNPDFGGRKLY